MTTTDTVQDAEAKPIPGRSISSRWIVVGSLALIATVATIIAFMLVESVALLSIATLLFAAFAFSHGVLRYGLRAMVVFVVVVVVIGWSFETLSIETGFPFGDYYYTSLMGAKLGQVPIAIMPSYFAFGYLSWALASVLLGKRDNGLSGRDLLVLPIVSSFIMVIWDLCQDPLCSTIMGEWIWEDGGAYFGVPLSNFFGWFLTVFTFYLIFAVYLRLSRGHTKETQITTRAFWVLPILMYASIALTFWGEWLLGADVEQVTDQAGQVWQTADILGSIVLISVFTMLFVSILGLFLLWREDAPAPAS
jgi:uncharacterized membrane protein